MTQVFIAIGSNYHRDKNINAAISALKEQHLDLLISPTYQTPSYGFDGPDFFNLLATFESTQAHEDIVSSLKAIEVAQGRNYSEKKSPRISIDLDLLLYGSEIINNENHQLPHPDILRYPFILQGLAELAPNLQHPILKQSFTELYAQNHKDFS